MILPPDSNLRHIFERMAAGQRMVFFAGLPGVGKSLLLKQLALLAHAAGRRVHTLQWDVARPAFETPDLLTRYPESEGVTHPALRKAIGLWARRELLAWHANHPDPAHMLIGEVPLIGNRLIELVQHQTDPAEGLLNSKAVLFVLPVPSREVRQAIETARAASIANPQHAQEKHDAPPAILDMLWCDVHRLAHHLGLPGASPDETSPYDPVLYRDVYLDLLRHRHSEVLPLDRLLPVDGSVYDVDSISSQLAATPAEAASMLAWIEKHFTPDEINHIVDHWYEIQTQ